MEKLPYSRVAVTGASGYVGRQVVAALADGHSFATVLALDIRLPEKSERRAGVEYEEADVRSADFTEIFRRHGIELVVHLAAIVTPAAGMSRELEFAVDVTGTGNVLAGCAGAGVRKIIYTSSGAAYGYHADNPGLLHEDDPLRGNPEFAYSDHKRLVEEMLERWRESHPELVQLILRSGTILGADAHNQITDMFDRAVVFGVRGASAPFVLVWDQDVVGAILHAIHAGGSGIYNLAGDGTLALPEIAHLLNKPYVALPAGLLEYALAMLHRLGLSQYGPEQVGFLRYRPVLDNSRLKTEFGYVPRRTTRETFEFFVNARSNHDSGEYDARAA